MTTEYGSVACDGADLDQVDFICKSCQFSYDDDADERSLSGWLVDTFLMPAAVVMATAIAAMFASVSAWITLRCWLDILGKL